MYRFLGQNLGQWQPNVAPEDVLIDDDPPPQTSSADSKKYCTNFPPGACIDPGFVQSVRNYANEMCPKPRVPQAKGVRGGMRGLFGGLGKICSIYSSDMTITTRNAGRWDPCVLKTLPVCRKQPPPPAKPPTYVVEDPPVIITSTPEEPEEEEDDNASYMVGGILAVLVLGGVGYAVFKNRKKGKRKKTRRKR